MALVNKVDLKMKVDIDTSIKYQILSYCFFQDILISNSDLKFLSELSKSNNIELTKFLSSTIKVSKETKDYITYNICSLLYPFAPHISSELYHMYSNENLAQFPWPNFDEANLTNPTYELVVQINGKKKHTKIINTDTSQEEAEKICEKEFEIEVKNYKKIIFVKDKIINFIG